MLQAIEVTLLNKERLRVVVDAVVGPYAVHNRIFNGKVCKDGWTVTHIKAGVAVWTTYAFSDALRVAEWLLAENTMPEGSDELLQWLEKEGAAIRTQLMDQLQRLAPRRRMGPDWDRQEVVWS